MSVSKKIISSKLTSLAPDIQAMHVLEVCKSLPERGVLSDGRLRPVIVFGLQVEKELLESMPGYPGEEAAAEQGVFYLSMPCSEKELFTMMDQVKEYAGQPFVGCTTGMHPKVISLLRSFKHVCENMKSSLKAQANRSRFIIKENPVRALASLDGFNDAMVARLSKERNAVRFWVGNMKRLDLEEIDHLMAEIKRLVGEIGRIKGTRIEEAVEMALLCAEAVENMMKTLARAVERLDHA